MKSTFKLAGLVAMPATHLLINDANTGRRNTQAKALSDNIHTISKWNDNWDGLHSAKPASNNQKRTLIFVRHGQYETADDDKGRVLTALGRQQAQNTGDRLALLCAPGAQLPPLDDIVYSTMTRASETHDLIYKQLVNSPSSFSPAMQRHSKTSQPCDLIREGAVCRPEPDTWRGPTDKDYLADNARIEKAFKTYVHRSINGSPDTDSDTDTDVDDGASSNSTLFVCHGNVIRYLVMRALQLPPEAWLRTSVANASITIVTIHASGRVSLQCLGDTGHLCPAQITFN